MGFIYFTEVFLFMVVNPGYYYISSPSNVSLNTACSGQLNHLIFQRIRYRARRWLTRLAIEWGFFRFLLSDNPLRE
jgi:hypothetical protein